MKPVQKSFSPAFPEFGPPEKVIVISYVILIGGLLAAL
jgi:hypothetical protein